MSEKLTQDQRRPGAVPTVLIWLALGLGLAAVLACAAVLAVTTPLPGRAEADPVTGLVSLLGDWLGRLLAMLSLGLATALATLLPTAKDELAESTARKPAAWLGRSAQLWLATSLMMTFVNSAFVAGVPIEYTLRPGIWWYLLGTTPSSLAWLVNAVVALATAITAYRARRPASFALVWLAGVLAITFLAMAGNVSVGLDHDWATDAAAAATVAASVLASGAIGLLVAGLNGVPVTVGDRWYHRLTPWLLLLIGLGQALIAWQQLAGELPWQVLAGVPILAGAVVWLGLLTNWGWWQLGGADRPAARLNSLARDVALLILGATCLSLATHLPPPRFLVPQTSQINYLGYDVEVPATIARLAGLGRPNLLWVMLCLLAIGWYLWGVARVRRAGGRWPAGRIAFWLAGWLLTFYLATSGLWMYSTAAFSWHMLVHMTVNMMVPVLCVLGAPITLLLTAWPLQNEAGPRRPSDVISELGQHRLVRIVLSPPVLWLNYISSLFLVYFTPLFGWLMRYHWAHQLMLLHFMVAGYLFFNLLIGPDRGLWRLPYLVKFALLISVMPFHAIFAVGIMMARTVIGETFYRTIEVSWVPDLLADQNIAGQITWFTGEVPAFVAVLLLAAQWFRSDSAQARVVDQRLDSGDDELEAYNDMLAQLAQRDRNPTARGEAEDD